MQRISTLICTLALLLGMTFLSPSYALAAVTATDYTPTVTESEISVFLETSKDNIHIWIWDDATGDNYDNTDKKWPGDAMELMGTANGKKIYKWTYNGTSCKATNIIFTYDNGTKFSGADGLTDKGASFKNHGYYVEGAYSKTIEVEQPIGKVMVFFDNSEAKLNDVYCYIYDGTKAAQEWPGLKMSLDNETEYNGKTGYYTVEVPKAFLTGYFVINNGEAGKTLSGETVYVNGVATAIETTTVADVKKVEDNAWYTLTGIRINKPTQPGLYIHNGKKVIIRK